VSVPTAELSAPPLGARGRTSATAIAGRLAGGRLYVALGGLALVIAALSLLIPSTPSYDPWAWLVWGREIIHLNLHTTGGPTWKPLPVLFTTVFALFGKAQPDLWLVVARAGAVMSVAMVFKVAIRVTSQIGGLRPAADGAPRRALGAALLAGVIAAGSLVVSRGFISDNALGYSEGLMTALVLISIDLHLGGRRRGAFAVGFLAALDRPELWLFWGSYGLYLFWKDPGSRRLVITLFIFIPILWFLPEYWGSGHFFRGVSRAHSPRSNSPAFAKCPICTELYKHAWPTLLFRVKAMAFVAMAFVAFGLWRTRNAWRHGDLGDETQRARATLLLCGAAGIAWWVLIGILTQAGFSGNDRYLVLGAALLAIAGGAGWGWAANVLADLAPRLPLARLKRPAFATSVGAVVAAVVFLGTPPWIGNHIVKIQSTHRALVYQANLRRGAAAAVAKLGGPSKVLACGSVMTEGFQVPMLAWTLGVHTDQIRASPLPHTELPPAPNVIFQTRAQHHAHLLPVVGAWKTVPYRLVARTRTFRVYESCERR
jgi:hypothetical protein